MGVRERGDIDRCEVNAELAGIFGEKAACTRVKKRGVLAVLDKNRETPFAFAKPCASLSTSTVASSAPPCSRQIGGLVSV